MVALQTASPSLGPPLVVLIGFLFVGSATGAITSAVVRRLSNPVSKYRLLYAGVLVPLTLGSYAILALLGFGVAVVSLVPALPGPLTTVTAKFSTFIAAGLVWLAAYAPTVRGVREVRDIELPTTGALARMARYVIGVSVILAVVITPLDAISSQSTPLVLAVGLALVVLTTIYLSPWLIPLLRSTESPTGEVADRIATLCSRATLDVRDVKILETDAEQTASTVVRGPPTYRRLFVTSTFLDAFDDETATALLALEAGRIRYHVLEIRVSAVVGAGIALIGSVTGVASRWLLVGLSLAIVLVGFWLSRRRIRAADAYAAGQVGTAVLTDALRRYAESHAMEPTRRRIPNPLSMTVALGDRIDSLQHRTES